MRDRRRPIARDAESQRQLLSDASALRDVAELLETTLQDLTWIVYRSGMRTSYQEFEIPRRRGGPPRVIHAPAPPLKRLQRKLAATLELIYRPQHVVCGFVPKRGIRRNASGHLRKRVVLNIDLKDFFPSINFGRIRGMLMAEPYGIAPAVATVFAQIACFKNTLPQGGPTSPILSNMICSRLDTTLRKLAHRNQSWYSRYADDITFSTWRSRLGPGLVAHAPIDGASLELGEDLLLAIKSNGFEVNPGKSRYATARRRQTVTGVKVNRILNVDRRFVRNLRAMLWDWEQRGEEGASLRHSVRRFGDSTAPPLRSVVRGRLAYLHMIKGASDPVYVRLWNRFARLAGCEPLPQPLPAALQSESEHWMHHYSQFARSIAYLAVETPRMDATHGTAFRVGRGWYLTVRHNMRTPDSVLHVYVDDEPLPVCEFVPHPDAQVDLALLRVAEHGGAKPVAMDVATEAIEPAAPVAALGYPAIAQRQPGLHLRGGFFAGRFEGPSPDYAERLNYLTLDIKNSGGMSGSPVISLSGSVVAVIVGRSYEPHATAELGQEFPQALPSALAEPLLALIPPTDRPSRRGWRD